LKVKAPSHTTVVAYAALFFAMGGTAVAATGGTFVLGRANSATTPTSLTNGGSGPVLALSTRTGQVPLAVSAVAGKATNLNADKLDGLDSSQIQRRTNVACPSGQAVTAITAAGGVTCAAVSSGQAPAPNTTLARDKGFAISDLQLRADSLGDWSGVARITNETSAVRTGTFTITIFRNNSIAATLRGSVSELAPGATNTVDFVTSDDFTEGEYITTFQTDSAF
jgi:hypothetical protein